MSREGKQSRYIWSDLKGIVRSDGQRALSSLGVYFQVFAGVLVGALVFRAGTNLYYISTTEQYPGLKGKKEGKGLANRCHYVLLLFWVANTEQAGSPVLVQTMIYSC
ncbi:uncharacterized protein ASPGLDRAFT_1419217 [Aspergillus glaucus CBS 516.65]|uniref:Uncharacterized protein n=1 Tax=Aspergillus glaucus CBS 516.65 TaxID=1160497 RepID=A0A1L9VMG1_ASPGL|nr:hypothetical protein ASPGLDRAFT_1419217 [Aspergillus glaucus CBS 516.65]OJJ85113.1 hypothetical protein ASPGLDRAFT_1419217 [Aspergillus glaucus CBS 516.65]